MNFQTFQDKFVEWIISDVEAKKIDGFPVCPFARKARLTNKIQFLDCRDNLKSDYQAFDKSVYEIAIVISNIFKHMIYTCFIVTSLIY